MKNKKMKGRGKRMNQELIKEIRTMSDKIEDIPKVTEKIILDLKSKQFPIPIVKILQELSFLVGTQKLPDRISGYVAINNDLIKQFGTNKVVCINSNDSVGHQRFTIAHELAHYIYDFCEESESEFYDTYDKRKENSETEIRANKFAANLLMPEDEFTKMYNIGLQIGELEEYFGVSQTAVIKRISELNLVETA